MQTTQLVSSALRALGFDVYDGAGRVVEGSGDPKSQSTPASTAKPESPGFQAIPVPPPQQQQQQQQDGSLTGAGAELPANARREGDPDGASVGGTVPTGAAQSPEASSSMGEVAEQGDHATHRSDSAGEAPVPADVSLTLGGLSHMVCFVRLEDTLWLVDCGFGGSAPTQPVAIDGGINIIDAAQVCPPSATVCTDGCDPLSCWHPALLTEAGLREAQEHHMVGRSTSHCSFTGNRRGQLARMLQPDVGTGAGAEASSAAGTAGHHPHPP